MMVVIFGFLALKTYPKTSAYMDHGAYEQFVGHDWKRERSSVSPDHQFKFKVAGDKRLQAQLDIFFVRHHILESSQSVKVIGRERLQTPDHSVNTSLNSPSSPSIGLQWVQGTLRWRHWEKNQDISWYIHRPVGINLQLTVTLDLILNKTNLAAAGFRAKIRMRIFAHRARTRMCSFKCPKLMRSAQCTWQCSRSKLPWSAVHLRRVVLNGGCFNNSRYTSL